MTEAELRACARIMKRVALTPGPLESPCWISHGISGRYALARVEGQVHLAHRLLFRLVVGEPLPGRHLHHRCENTRCSNPTHLEELTPAQHSRLGQSPTGRRARQTHCKRNHPFDEENTRVDTRGHRRCRACRRAGIG